MGCCSLTARIFSRRNWLAAFGLAAGCRRGEPLPVHNTIPPFQLTSQAGTSFDSGSLRGAPWIASFFFASCNGPCPRLNTEIHNLQEKTYGFKGLKIVSFTVDPERDTPEVLAAYAKRYKADPDRWFFLTGSRATISALAKDAFQVGSLDTQQSHTTRVMLVDRDGRVRGHFPTATPEELDALYAGISMLYQEGS